MGTHYLEKHSKYMPVRHCIFEDMVVVVLEMSEDQMVVGTQKGVIGKCDSFMINFL